MCGWFVLLAVVVGVATGVAAPAVTGCGLRGTAIATLSAAVLVDVAWARRLLLVAACAAGAAAHGARTRDRVLDAPAAVLAHVPAKGEAIQIEGRLASDAVRTDDGAQLEIQLSAVSAGGRRVEVAGRVRAHVAGKQVDAHVAEWRGGRPIRAPATIRAPAWLHNPGGPSPRWQALTRGVDVVASIKSAALVEVGQGRVWHEAAAAVRAHVRDVAARYVAPRHPQSAAIMTAVLIGDRAAIDEEVTARLQAAGTYHVIAISGGNVALVAGLVWLSVRLLVRGHRAGTMAALGGVLAYGFVVGGDASVTRAVAVAVVYLALTAAGLTSSLLRIVTVVAAGTLLVDPLMVVDVGAWLSYGATVGIVVCAPRIVQARPGMWRMRSPRLGGWGLSCHAAWRFVAGAVRGRLVARDDGRRVSVGPRWRCWPPRSRLSGPAPDCRGIIRARGRGGIGAELCRDSGHGRRAAGGAGNHGPRRGLVVAASWGGAVVDIAARMIVDSARLVDLAAVAVVARAVSPGRPGRRCTTSRASIAIVRPPTSWRRQCRRVPLALLFRGAGHRALQRAGGSIGRPAAVDDDRRRAGRRHARCSFLAGRPCWWMAVASRGASTSATAS